ncbi:pre-mRNA branch site protein p14 [Strigomonas culicis]|uniref:Pre-mRNA branch site protein p14 n=1 Tax=Strigomonas culicis TaxID=28005 RepID=S9UQ89_9TRYP|nr:pre-mRNA branch site protein p14 [Strigomonas culicis]EPY33067.1 pre-mRNA branch site protein p14 [Strigomonas culicis]|eukprot:EPY32432.1 pre-mRNA branch site protein p14 [Strigomonas culicis]
MSDERILLVTGIPSKGKGDFLYKLFQEYGAIRQIRIGSSSITKGCAIVVYEQCDSAATAMAQLNSTKMLKVSVYDENRDKRALDKRKRRREAHAEFNKHVAQSGEAAEEQ